MVPKMIQRITTKDKNTAILALLSFKAMTKFVDSPIYQANFKILNTLSNLSALNATSEWEPTNMNDKYMGRVESKSMIP